MSTSFSRVPTGNGEPEIWRDADGRAVWADGSRVTLAECSDTPAHRAAAIARHGLDVGASFDLDLVGRIVAAHHLKVVGANGLDTYVVPVSLRCRNCARVFVAAWVDFQAGGVEYCRACGAGA